MRGIFVFILSLFFIQANAQGINFQGVARGANGTIIASAKISLRLSIIAKSANGTPEYVETRIANTNAQGIFSIVLGDTSIVSSVGSFKNINWKEGQKFLKVEMDPTGGTNYVSMGTTQLQNVPFSYYSLGVDATNVNGILPVAKGGTGVATIGEIKTLLGLDYTTKDSAVFAKDISVSSLTVGKGAGKVYSNTALGRSVLKKNTLGYNNIAIGDSALMNNTFGMNNVAIGVEALKKNDSTGDNTAIGWLSLQNNITGWANTGVGSTTLMSNTTGTANIAVGSGALELNTTGNFNTGVGIDALHSNTEAGDNTALGSNALYNNNGTGIFVATPTISWHNGSGNTAVGSSALFSNTIGSFNTAVGSNTLPNLKTGINNTGIGVGTLNKLVDQGDNTAIGAYSLANSTTWGSTAVGTHTLRANTTGNSNTAIGTYSTYQNTTGSQNTALGNYGLSSNTTGSQNTAIGSQVLKSNVNGSNNTALGLNALYSNVSNNGSTAVGTNAMYYADDRTSGRITENTAIGYEALKGSPTAANNTGMSNTGVGHQTLYSNTSGIGNVAVGAAALYNNTTGTVNAAIGQGALLNNTIGTRNIAIGYQSLAGNIANSGNIAIGYGAMAFANNTTTNNNSENLAIGSEALKGSTTPAANTGYSNVSVGSFSLRYNTTGSNNTALGVSALELNTTGYGNTAIGNGANVGANNLTNATAIGNGAIVTASNTMQLGNQGLAKVTTKAIVASSKGFLAQGITVAERDAISSPEQGLIIYCNDCGDNGELQVYNGSIWKSFTLGTASTTNTTAQGLLNGLAAYYSFAGNTNEAVTGTNTGTVVGATLANDKFNVSNKSYQFNGTSNYISLPNAFLGGVQKTQVSISMNFYLDQLPAANNSYYLWQKNGFWQGLGVGVDYQGKLTFGGSITTYKYQSCISNANAVAPGQWYNLVIVYNNTDCKMYLNGTLINTVLETSSQSGTKLSDTMAGFVEFGQNAGGNSASTNTFGASHAVDTGYVAFFKGKLDEFRIYDRLLTTNEISYLATH